MSSPLPNEIEVTDLFPEGVRYAFPRRNLGRAALVVWLAIAIQAAFAWWLLEKPLATLVFKPFGWWAVAWLVFWMVITFVLLRFSLWLTLAALFGRREVELSEGQLRAGERIRGMRRTKSWPLALVKRLQIVSPISTKSGEQIAGILEQLCSLTVVLDDDKRVLLVPGYPRSWLDAFAAELSGRFSAAPEKIVVETAPPIGMQGAVEHAIDMLNRGPELWEQPAGSTVQFEKFADGITLRVPPRGLRRGSAGLFQFGVVWCAFIFLFTVIFLFAGGIADIPKALAMMSIFWLIGAALLLAGWNMGRREAVIAVVAESVMTMQTGLFGPWRHEWPRHVVKQIRVGPSGMEVNGVPVPELQFHGPKGKLLGMLAGRDERELAWMATLLRQALRETRDSSLETDSPPEPTVKDNIE